MIARQVLQSLGLDVVEATDGREAIATLDSVDVDAVLMDCQMPVMDGYSAAKEIRRRESATGADAELEGAAAAGDPAPTQHQQHAVGDDEEQHDTG